MLRLAILTGEELANNGSLGDPSEMAAWQYYDFACGLVAEKAFAALCKEMGSAYYQSEDRPEVVEAFLIACAAAVTTDQVAEVLGSLKQEKGFRISVTHPDSNQEFVGVE
jgi:hypothetical protein